MSGSACEIARLQSERDVLTRHVQALATALTAHGQPVRFYTSSKEEGTLLCGPAVGDVLSYPASSPVGESVLGPGGVRALHGHGVQAQALLPRVTQQIAEWRAHTPHVPPQEYGSLNWCTVHAVDPSSKRVRLCVQYGQEGSGQEGWAVVTPWLSEASLTGLTYVR